MMRLAGISRAGMITVGSSSWASTRCFSRETCLFLAEDVGKHLDTVLDEILRTLSHRRKR